MVQPNPDIPYNHPIWLNPNFVWPPVGRGDLILACVTFGFFLGFGFLTCNNAYRQISAMRNPRRSTYAWMVWGEIVANIIIAVVVFLLLIGAVMPSFWLWFGLLCVWVFQVQLILQILCNRCAMVEVDDSKRKWVKIITLIIVGMINVTVFCIWIPARMQISLWYMHINDIWDRITKVLLLLIDLALNIYFIRSVKSKLVNNGLQKYDKLVKFNIRIIILSISLDVVLVGTMSINGIVYGIVQSTMYIVKLNIEISLSALIILIAKEKDVDVWLSEAEMSRERAHRSTIGRSTFRSISLASRNNRSTAGNDVDEITSAHDGAGLSRPQAMSLAKPTLAHKRSEGHVVSVTDVTDEPASSQGSVSDMEIGREHETSRASSDYPLQGIRAVSERAWDDEQGIQEARHVRTQRGAHRV